MNAAVIYASVYGNTAQVAAAVAQGLGERGPVVLLEVGALRPDQLAGYDLVVAGSPTQRFQPLPAMSAFLDALPASLLTGVRVAAFDTRIELSSAGPLSFVLKFYARRAGDGAYAAKHLADALQRLGGQLTAPPEGFMVDGNEGPLRAGELDRARTWGLELTRPWSGDGRPPARPGSPA